MQKVVHFEKNHKIPAVTPLFFYKTTGGDTKDPRFITLFF